MDGKEFTVLGDSSSFATGVTTESGELIVKDSYWLRANLVEQNINLIGLNAVHRGVNPAIQWEAKIIDQKKSAKLLETSRVVCVVGGAYPCQVEPNKSDLITIIPRRWLEVKNEGERVLQPVVEWGSHRLRRGTCTEGILVLD